MNILLHKTYLAKVSTKGERGVQILSTWFMYGPLEKVFHNFVKSNWPITTSYNFRIGTRRGIISLTDVTMKDSYKIQNFVKIWHNLHQFYTTRFNFFIIISFDFEIK